MFGEVGGLKDFLSPILAFMFSTFSKNFLQAQLVKSLYRSIENGNQEIKSELMPVSSAIRFSSCFVIHQVLKLGCLGRKQDKMRLKRGLAKIDGSLDIVKLIKNANALAILLRLLLSKPERRLVRI